MAISILAAQHREYKEKPVSYGCRVSKPVVIIFAIAIVLLLYAYLVSGASRENGFQNAPPPALRKNIENNDETWKEPRAMTVFSAVQDDASHDLLAGVAEVPPNRYEEDDLDQPAEHVLDVADRPVPVVEDNLPRNGSALRHAMLRKYNDGLKLEKAPENVPVAEDDGMAKLLDSLGGYEEQALPAGLDVVADDESQRVSGDGTLQQGAAPRVTRQATPALDAGREKVVMDVRIANSGVYRLELLLYRRELPRTTENFLQLCNGFKNTQGATLGYAGSQFHRVIKGFMMQGGQLDPVQSRDNSIYGKSFDDEGFFFKHDGRGKLAMANTGPNTNGSQFFITFNSADWLDGKHVVLGEVLSGWDALDAVEALPIDSKDRPLQPVSILACRQEKRTTNTRDA